MFNLVPLQTPQSKDYCRAFAKVNERVRASAPQDAAAAALFCRLALFWTELVQIGASRG